jgi:hypothetical protein
MQKEEYHPVKTTIGIDRSSNVIKMVFDPPVGDTLSLTPEEAEKLGLSLIGRAAILMELKHEEKTPGAPE